MIDDVDIRRARVDVGRPRIRWFAIAIKEQSSGLVLRMPLWCANPAVAITSATAIFVRFEKEGVDHAVAEEWKIRTLRVELAVGSVAIISAGDRVRNPPDDFQVEIVLAAHRF